MTSLRGGARGGGGANPPPPPPRLASAAPPAWNSAPPCIGPKRPAKPTEGEGPTAPAPAAEAAGRDGVGNVLGTTSRPAEAPGSCVVSPLASGGALRTGNPASATAAMPPALLRGCPSSRGASSLRCGSGGVGLGGRSAGSGSGGRPAAARASDAASEARGVAPSPAPAAPVAPGVGAVGNSATAGESSSPPSPPEDVSQDSRLRGTERSAEATPASPSSALPPSDSAAPPDARPKAQSSTLRGDWRAQRPASEAARAVNKPWRFHDLAQRRPRMRGAPEVVAREHEVARGGVLPLLVQRAVSRCCCRFLCCNHLCDSDCHAHRALRVAAAGAAEVAPHGARGARQLRGGERQRRWAPAGQCAGSLGRRGRDAPGRRRVARSAIVPRGGCSGSGGGGRRGGRGRRRRNGRSALCGAFCAPRRSNGDFNRRQQLRGAGGRRRRGVGRGGRRRRGGELQPQRGAGPSAARSQHLRVAARAGRLRDAAGADGEAAGSCAAARRLRHGLATGADAAGAARRAAQPRKARAPRAAQRSAR